MKRNIFRYFGGLTLAFLAGIGLAGCADDNGLDLPNNPESDSGYIVLNLKCVEGTRAPEDEYTEDGVNSLNENRIETVTICLWAKGGDKPDDTAKPDYVQTFTNVDKNTTASFRIPLSLPLKHVLFETSDAECHAFAAVNVDIPEGEFTIADLRDLTVESTFSSQKRQASFTMDGDCVVSFDPVANSATGAIDLKRSASKITLALDVDPIVEQTALVDGTIVTSKWQADPTAMRVWLKGGLAESTLDPKLDAEISEAYFFDTPDDITYPFVGNNTDNGNNAPQGKNYPYIQDVPFYTYPHRWTDSPDDYAATFMILSIPWMQVQEKEGSTEENPQYEQVPGTSWRTCYYQVPVIAENSELLELVRNVSYHVYLHVGLLGSFDPDVPIVLDKDLEYSAADWGAVNVDVTIPAVRYLVVDQNDYTVNNETSIHIPFYTSHETVVTDATMTFYRYNFSDAGEERAVTVTMEQNEESAKSNRAGEPVFIAYFNNETKELEVSHDLVMYEALDNNGAVVSFTNNDGSNISASHESRKPKTEAQWKSLVLDKIKYYRKVSKTSNEDNINEYSRVEYKITVQHLDLKGTPNFKEEITITQYPGMYITTIANYHGGDDATTFNFTGAQGNTFINTYYINRDGDNRPSKGIPLGWTSSIGLNSSFLNFNPNMYLVTVTSLPENTEYSIGDPRSNYINNNLESINHNYDPVNELGRNPNSNNFYGNYTGTKPNQITTNAYSVAAQTNYVKALITDGVNSGLPSGQDTKTWKNTLYSWYYWAISDTEADKGNLNGFVILKNSSGSVNVTGFEAAEAIYPSKQKRNLNYYYPTLEDNAHKMMIAPKFRICSSYAGTTWILNRELARRRAAAYQEMGYPAGRWRLPTFGEVKFIMELAASYKIPRLFGTYSATWWYWCAQGLVCVPSKKSNSRNVYLPDDNGFELPFGWGARDCQRARFVYDEWYWGDADLKANGTIGSSTPVYTFTWGDRPMNN